MSKYDDYLEARRNRRNAEEWNDLPKGDKYQNDTFSISTIHCGIKLTRCGQKSCGGKNYWETDNVFGQALAEVIKEDPEIIKRAIEKLKALENKALIECKDYAQYILNAIEKVQ